MRSSSVVSLSSLRWLVLGSYTGKILLVCSASFVCVLVLGQLTHFRIGTLFLKSCLKVASSDSSRPSGDGDIFRFLGYLLGYHPSPDNNDSISESDEEGLGRSELLSLYSLSTLSSSSSDDESNGGLPWF